MKNEKLRLKAVKITREFIRLVNDEGLTPEELDKQVDLIEEHVLSFLQAK